MVLIAQVEPYSIHTDNMGGNQHALKNLTGTTVQIGQNIPIFECTHFPFINIDDHMPRTRLRANGFPFSPSWKSSPPQST